MARFPQALNEQVGYEFAASQQYVAIADTDRGTIQIDLLTKEAPNTVNNFVFLAREGFYDGVPFHRVIKDFMVQTGDPSGTGRGNGLAVQPDSVSRRRIMRSSASHSLV